MGARSRLPHRQSRRPWCCGGVLLAYGGPASARLLPRWEMQYAGNATRETISPWVHTNWNSPMRSRYPTRNQFFPHAWPAEFALDLRVNRLDVRQQSVVALAAALRLVLRGALPVLMKAAGADIQHLA
jgi:hypothetical protein